MLRNQRVDVAVDSEHRDSPIRAISPFTCHVKRGVSGQCSCLFAARLVWGIGQRQKNFRECSSRFGNSYYFRFFIAKRSYRSAICLKFSAQTADTSNLRRPAATAPTNWARLEVGQPELRKALRCMEVRTPLPSASPVPNTGTCDSRYASGTHETGRKDMLPCNAGGGSGAARLP